MPVDIKFLEDGIGVEFIASGVVTAEEIIAANKKIYMTDNLLRLKYQIIDRTTCTDYRVTSKDIETIASQERQASKINPEITMLLVAPSDLLFGMSRVLQAHVSDTGFDFKIFPNRTEADKYVKDKFGSSTS